MQKLIKWLHFILVILTLIAFLSPLIPPSRIWEFVFLAHLFPIFLLFNLFFGMYWVYKKNWFVVLSLFTFLVCFTGIKKVFGFSFSSKDTGKQFTCSSYNLGGLQWLDFADEKDNRELKRFLNRLDNSDILFVQEVNKRALKALKSSTNYPYFHKHRALNTAIFSRYSIVDQGSIEFEKSFNSGVWADIKIEGKIIRCFSIHLESNRVSQMTEKSLTTEAVGKKNTYQRALKILARVKKATIQRSAQSKQVKELIRKSPYPVLIGGDFNDTPMSYVYQTLSTGMKDSFTENYFGFGATYNGKIPLLRIDYILASTVLNLSNHQVEKVPYSDHNPITTNFSFEKN